MSKHKRKTERQQAQKSKKMLEIEKLGWTICCLENMLK